MFDVHGKVSKLCVAGLTQAHVVLFWVCYGCVGNRLYRTRSCTGNAAYGLGLRL